MTGVDPFGRLRGVSERQFLFTLGLPLAFASMSTDLFLRALPAMTESLQAGAAELELVVSI